MNGLQPQQKNIIVYDKEGVGFGVRLTGSGKSGRKTCAFILACRIGARERRLTIGAWPDWSVTAALEEAKRLKREIGQGRLSDGGTRQSAGAAALLRTIRLRVPGDCEWVFPGEAEGKPLQSMTPEGGKRFLVNVMRQRTFIKRFRDDVRANAGLPAARIHNLRHTFASLPVSGD